jgi:hypothetical protein
LRKNPAEVSGFAGSIRKNDSVFPVFAGILISLPGASMRIHVATFFELLRGHVADALLEPHQVIDL